jgi:hypothetical protein
MLLFIGVAIETQIVIEKLEQSEVFEKMDVR